MLHDVAIFLAAAVIAVPLSRRLGLGAILGYLAAGMVIGPWGLRLKKIQFTVLEKSWEQVDFVRRFGNKIYYGDAARIAESVRHHFPHLRIFAVANDRNHALRLMDLGITDVIRRAYFSSLEMGQRLLVALGESEESSAQTVKRFREHDHATLQRQQAVYRDEKQLIQTAQEAARELEQLFDTDRTESKHP